MRALVIGTAAEEGGGIPERFELMLRELDSSGIRAEYTPSLDASRLLDLLRKLRPELVYSAPIYTAEAPAERRNVHGLLEEAGLPYLGSGPAVLELALDKAALKATWKSRGVETPDYLLVEPSEAGSLGERLAAARDFPYIVKPAQEGNSRGIEEDSVVRDALGLEERVGHCLRRYGPALVERFLGDEAGLREFTVALVGSGPSAYLLPAEIVLKQAKAVRLISTRDKDEHRTLARPVAEPLLRESLAAFAARAFEAAGLLDYARCDILMAGERLFAIEINGQPMIPDRWFEACAEGGGFGSNRYLAAIFLASISRQRAAAFPGLPLPPELLDRFTAEERARLQGFS